MYAGGADLPVIAFHVSGRCMADISLGFLNQPASKHPGYNMCRLTCLRSELQMAAVADDDSAAMDARPPRPAIEKLKHLGEVCSILKQKKFHDTFLASRGLHCLAG